MAVVKRLIGWLTLGPVALVALGLAVANRSPVVVSWNPFDRNDGLEMPLFVVGFVAFCLGVVAGGIAVWLAQGRWRRAVKAQRSEIKRLAERAGESRNDIAPLPQR